MTVDMFARMASRSRVAIRQRGYHDRGDVTAEELRTRFALFDNRCGYCGRTDVENLGMDHDIPLVRGGSNTIDNIVPACRHCNSRKHTQTGAEFREHPNALADEEFPYRPPPADFDGPLTPREVAHILKVSSMTVCGWITDGELPAVNIGKKQRSRWVIEEAKLICFLDSRSSTNYFAARSSTPPPEG